MQHLCNGCAAASLHVALCVCEQMCARGIGQLQQPGLLQQHPCIFVEWHRPRACWDELEGTVLLAFVCCVWHEQTVLPKIKGAGLGELRARAVSNSGEFCLVTTVLSPVVCIGVGAGLRRAQREEMHNFLSSVPVDWSFPN